jgi:hypothetical protein
MVKLTSNSAILREEVKTQVILDKYNITEKN